MDINATINSLLSNRLVRMGAILVGIALLVLLLMFGLPSVWNKFSNWAWSKGTESDKAEIQKALNEAQQAKGVAQAALKELEEAKSELATEKQKREAAEKILEDKRLATNDARKAYDRALAQPVATPPPDASTDELCARAAKLGIRCDP